MLLTIGKFSYLLRSSCLPLHTNHALNFTISVTQDNSAIMRVEVLLAQKLSASYLTEECSFPVNLILTKPDAQVNMKKLNTLSSSGAEGQECQAGT